MKKFILPILLAANLSVQAAPGSMAPNNNGKDWRTDDSWVNTQTRSFDVAADGTPTDVSKFLNTRGKAVLREADSTGNTMLHYAVRDNPDPEVARRLLALGASPKALNSLGMTPLMTAIRYNTDDQNVEILLQNGAEPNARDRKGDSPLFYAVNYRPEATLILTLIRYGANPALRNQAGKTALDIAIQRKCPGDVIAALASTASPQIDAKGDTPLTQAVRQGNLDAIQKLKVAGVNFNQVNAYGMTPLMVAVSTSQSAVLINTLLDCGADINWRDRNGRTALDYAIRYNNQIAINILQGWGYPNYYYHRYYNNPVIIRQTIYPGTRINYRQTDRDHPTGINHQENIAPTVITEYRDLFPYGQHHENDKVEIHPSADILIRGGHRPKVDYGLGFSFTIH